MRMTRWLVAVAALSLWALDCGCDMKQTITAPPPGGGGTLMVNEFLASNNGAGQDEFGENDDWVELYNPTDSPIDIAGYSITDNLGDPVKFVIPGGAPTVTTVPAHGYLLIWFDSQPDQGPLHVGSNLSASGEDIGFYTPSGQPLTELTYGPQTTDVSFGRTSDGGDTWDFLLTPSPGATNGSGGGNPKPVISGVTLDPATPGAGQAVTVRATITDNGTVASASLFYRVGAGDFASVTMTLAAGTWSAGIPAQAAGTTVSYYLRAVDDGAAVATLPATAPAAVLSYTVSGGAPPPVLFVNEFLASNGAGLTDDFGDLEDWIEIHNPGATAVDLGGFYITDDLAAPTKWQIPATDAAQTTVPAGGYLVLFADSEPGEGVRHVNIKLSASGEAIGLYTAASAVIDTVTFGAQVTDVSRARVPDGSANWVARPTPTPGVTNGSVPRP